MNYTSCLHVLLSTSVSNSRVLSMIETDWQIIWIRQTQLCSPCDSLKIHAWNITGQTAKLTPNRHLATGWPSSKWTYCGTSTGAQSNEALSRAGCWMSTATDGDGNLRKWMEITSAWPLRVTSAFDAATMEAPTRVSAAGRIYKNCKRKWKRQLLWSSVCVYVAHVYCQWCIPFSLFFSVIVLHDLQWSWMRWVIHMMFHYGQAPSGPAEVSPMQA
jgi:hypothetical protein